MTDTMDKIRNDMKKYSGYSIQEPLLPIPQIELINQSPQIQQPIDIVSPTLNSGLNSSQDENPIIQKILEILPIDKSMLIYVFAALFGLISTGVLFFTNKKLFYAKSGTKSEVKITPLTETDTTSRSKKIDDIMELSQPKSESIKSSKNDKNDKNEGESLDFKKLVGSFLILSVVGYFVVNKTGIF